MSTVAEIGRAHRQPDPMRTRRPHVVRRSVENSRHRPVPHEQRDGQVAEHVVEARGHDPVGQHVAPRPLECEHGVAPAATLVQADRQPGDDRDRSTAVEGQHVLGGGAGGGHRGVRREQLGPVAAQPQGGGRDTELGVAAVGEQRDPVVVVDGPAVVGVGQAVVPQLGALVDVRHPGDRQREQLGGEAVAATGRVERRDETVDDRTYLSGVERRVDRGVHRALVRRVGVGPGGVLAGLAHGLLGVLVQAFAARGPRADDRLPQQRPEAGVGQRHEREQPVERGLPDVRYLGQYGDPGPRVLAALGVVGGRRGHRIGPVTLPLGHRRVEVGGIDGEVRRVATDLVEGRQPGVAVEGAVLDALGHHHAAGLLEPQRRGVRWVGEDGRELVEGLGQVGAVVVARRRTLPRGARCLRGGSCGRRGSSRGSRRRRPRVSWWFRGSSLALLAPQPPNQPVVEVRACEPRNHHRRGPPARSDVPRPAAPRRRPRAWCRGSGRTTRRGHRAAGPRECRAAPGRRGRRAPGRRARARRTRSCPRSPTTSAAPRRARGSSPRRRTPRR